MGNTSVGYSLKLLMIYEFNVALVITNFYYVAELSSHSPLKFNFPTSFLYLWPKATCLINSSLKIWLVFGSLLNLLPPPHTRSLMQKLSTAGFRLWFLSFLTAPAHNQFVSRDMEKCQYVFSKVLPLFYLYIHLVQKITHLSTESLHWRKSLRS